MKLFSKDRGPARLVVKVSGFLHGGKAVVKFPANFRRARPEDRMSYTTQAIKAFRAEYDLAVEHRRIAAQHEDARNAEAVVLRTEVEA